MNLKTIAQKAGVSTATVSNVINGNHHKVSKDTIERVQKIIEETNYKPNATARSLVSKKSKIIGVVVSNIHEGESFSINPHYTHLLALLEKAIRSEGYYMMVRCVWQSVDSIPLFSSWNVDGMIFFGTYRTEAMEIRESLNVPAVFIDTYAENISNVGIDDYKGGYLAGKYLLDKGHTKVAIAAPNIHYGGVMKERFNGFRDACQEKNMDLTADRYFHTETDYEAGVETGRMIALSETGFTAVAVMSDIAAFGVMEGLRQKGKRIPEDVSVIGFDNLVECRYSYPQLTTVSQNVEQKAESVSKALFRMIQGNKWEIVNETSDVEVVERASVRDLRGNGYE